MISSYYSELLIDRVDCLTQEKRSELEKLAQLPRRKQRIAPKQMRSVIRKVCWEQYVTIGALAELVDRKPKFLQSHYLSLMVKDNELKLAFPSTPNDPRQAYITTQSQEEDLE